MPLTVRKFAHRLNMGKMLSSQYLLQFFFRSGSILQVTSRGKKAWSGSIMSRIGSFHLELSALECFLSMGKMLSSL